MRVRLAELAVRDLEDANAHYAGIDAALGGRFLGAVDAVIERLEMFPRGAPPVHGFEGVRRARLRGFPYGVFFEHPADDELVILRVLHARSDHTKGFGPPAD